jgi:ATP-dependent Clp protease, protease subunit
MKKSHLLLNAEGLGKVKNRISDGILARWDKTVVAKDEPGEATIDIFDVIGSDFFGEGFTAKRMSAALRSIGSDKDVTVNLNSPGGDFFEGATIYNQLAAHKGKVTVNVIGLAASAASFIAMAGDEVKISKAGFLMIHNAWSFVMGNKNDLRETADTLGEFDASMVSIYAARTGMDEKDISKMMDTESWINADTAIEKGFADTVIEVKKSDKVSEERQAKAQARRTIEMALAKENFSRKDREEIFQKAGLRDASDPAARDAGEWKAEEWTEVLQSLKN